MQGVLESVYYLFALIQQSANQPLWLTTTRTVAEIVWRFVAALGVIVGGLFAYYKFFKGREFSARVEPKLSAGRVIRREGTIYLQAEASAKNIGLSRVPIIHSSTYILVEVREWGAGEWHELEDVYYVFMAQEAIEPGEVAGEPILMEIPEGNYLAIRLTLGVAGPDNQWWAIGIVNLAEEADNGATERPE